MIRDGEVLLHKKTGSKIVIIQSAVDTNGEWLEIEQIIKPNAFLLPAHIHANQTEEWQVISGSAIYQLEDEYRSLLPGETVTFLPGVAHVNPRSASEVDLQVRMRVSPALDFHVLLDTIMRACDYGHERPGGTLSRLHGAVLLHGLQSKIYLVNRPIWLQKLMLPILSLIGRLAGYRVQYPEIR
jgi:mannose-6-phosphate isomerase-like protein (cupin superfamily)